MPTLNGLKNSLESLLFRTLLVCLAVSALSNLSQAQTTRTWIGATADMSVAGNWSGGVLPSTTANDPMLFDGSSAFNALTFNGGTFSGSNGVGNITIASSQTAALSINNAGTVDSVFRLKNVAASPANFTIQTGAGAVSFGTGGNAFFLNLTNSGVSGPGNVFTNDSTNLATFGTALKINASAGTGGKPIFTGSGDWFISSLITGAINQGVTKNGTGKLTLTNSTNAYTGGTTINGGTLQLDHENAANTGVMQVGNGTLILNHAPATSGFSSLTSLVGTTGAVQMTGVTGSYITKPMIVNGSLKFERSVNGAGVTTFSEVLSGSGTLVVDNTNGGIAPTTAQPGRAFFSNAANTFNGAVVVQNGGNFLNQTISPSYSSVDLGANSYFTLFTNSATSTTTIGTLTGSGNFTKNINNALAVISVGSGNFSGVISQTLFSAAGSVGLTKTSSGTLILSGNSTYTGGTTISDGTLQLNSLSGAGTGAVTIGNGTLSINHAAGTSDFSGLTSTVGTSGALAIQGASGSYIAKPITVNGTLEITRSVTGNGSTTFSGVLGGNGTLVIGNTNGGAVPSSGAQGRAFFSNAANTFNGDVQVLATGNFLNNTATNTYASLDIAAGGFATIIAGTANIGTLTGAGEIIRNTNSGSTATLAINDGNFSGLIRGNNAVEPLLGQGHFALSKVSAGTLTLSGANLYTGGTTITAGTLLANNTSGSATGTAAIVVNGGKLGGTGSVTGAVTLNSGGTISPGASIESLATGANTWNGGGEFDFEFSTDGSGTAGIQYDLLAIDGGLNLSGVSSGSPLTVNLFTMSDSATAGLLSAWDPDVDHLWSGFVTTTGITGFADDKFLIDPAGFQNTINGTFSIAQSGNNLDLVYIANVIPEPGSVAVILLGLGVAIAVRRRKS